MESGRASRTAVLVCQGRAVADGRLGGPRFSDPWALDLLDADEQEQVLRARSGERVEGRQRFEVEALLACAEVMVPRTVLIDDAVREAVATHHDAQLVVLGAGLDDRAWRLPELAGMTLFAVDHPASGADARRRQQRLPRPPVDLRAVDADLVRTSVADALARHGHDRSRPSVVVWEGVVPYLTPGAVAGTVSSLSTVTAPGSVLVVQYQQRWATASLARWASGLMARAAGASSPLADEPWRSTWAPDELAALLHAHGWAVRSDVDLLAETEALGSPHSRSRSLRNGRVAVAGR